MNNGLIGKEIKSFRRNIETVRKESKENTRTGLHYICNKKSKGLDTSKE